MTGGRRVARPRTAPAVAALAGLLALAAAVATAAEPRGTAARAGGREGTVAAAAAATRPARAAASERPGEDGAARRRDGAAPEAAEAAPVLPPLKSDLENQPLRRKEAGNATSRPTTQKSAARPSAGGFEAARVITALGVVLVLILLLRWIGRRFFGGTGGGRSTRAVQVLSRSPISPRQQLVLLRVGRRLLVVADGGGQMNTLSEITDPDEVAGLLGQLQDDHAGRMTTTFGNLLGRMRGPFDRGDAQGLAEHAELDAQEATADDADAVRRPAAAGGRAEPDAPAVESTRRELSGLMDKVRMLSRQFKSP